MDQAKRRLRENTSLWDS